MKAPTCPEHGNLVLDLARGRLNDAEAVRADVVRGSCPLCAGWWDEAFSDPATASVDSAVAEAFSVFKPPAAGRRVWLAAAAAAVLAVGVGITTMLWHGGEAAPPIAAGRVPGAEEVLSVWDFEDGALTPNAAAVVSSEPADRADADEAVYANDLESGDLGSWTFHS